jgi:iron complex outermembrane recepter protein
MPLRHARTLALAAALALPPLSAVAQGSEGDTARPLPLDTLTARVLRTPLPAHRAPYAVSVASGEALTRAQPGLGLDEALAAVPGVQVDNRYNPALGERIAVRGFGARAQFGVRGVRVLVDGLPATLPDGQTTLNHVDPGSLARAEVVRGPASALYGNAAGGVIRLSTFAPPAVPLRPEYRATFGAHGLARMQAQAAGQSGAAGYRASVTRLEYGGYRDHSGAGSTLANGTLLWSRGPGALRLVVHAVRYDALNPGSLTDSLLRADRGAVAPVYTRFDTGERGRQAQLGLTWERASEDGGGVEVTGYVLGRSIENPIPFAWIELDRRVGGFRASFASCLGPLRWTVGGEAEEQRDHRRNFANDDGAPGERRLDQRERVTALAAFGQAAVEVGRVDVLGALRYDRFRFRADDRLVTAENPDDSGARTMDAWSPTLGVSVAASRALSVYANVSTAFETPTTTELANRPTGAGGFNAELEPQRTTSVEVGARARAGAAFAEVAAYRARVRDALIPFEVPSTPGRQFFRNAGRAVHRGVEVAAGVSPVRDLTARLAYTWTDARFGRYRLNDSTDLEGNRVPGIAPHRVEATLYWRSARGPFAGVDARRVSFIPVKDDDAAGRFASPAYTLVDARLGWEELRVGPVRATPSLGVTNLFDALYNASVVVNAAGARFYEPGPGRAVYVGLDVALGRSR